MLFTPVLYCVFAPPREVPCVPESFSVNSSHLTSLIYPTIVTGSTAILLSVEPSTHRSLPYLSPLDIVLISWAEQFLKNANYRLDLAADT